MATGSTLILLLLISLLFIVVASTVLKLHPFLSLLLGSLLFGVSAGFSLTETTKIITEGFGKLMAGIGLIIVLGTIIGSILERTRAAERMALAVLHFFSAKRLIPAISAMGGLVGIAVFCDSGFIILSELNKKLSKLGGVGRVSLNIALAGGLYATHVLVPPTPGPLAAAGNIGAEGDLGMVILLGLLCTVPALLVNTWWAGKQKKEREEKMETEEEIEVSFSSSTKSDLPSLWGSVLPIFVPVILIALASVLKLIGTENAVFDFFISIGNPNISLLIGVVLAFFLFKKWDKRNTMDLLDKSIQQAGPILLITCAGGAYGAVISETPIVELFQSITEGGTMNPIWLFPMIFLLAAGLKTAQGSSTASMVITSSIIASLLPVWGLTGSIDLALVVIVTGAGAMTVSHANDSYFWVVNNFGGMKMAQTYRTFTVASLLQGVTVLCFAMLLKLLL